MILRFRREQIILAKSLFFLFCQNSFFPSSFCFQMCFFYIFIQLFNMCIATDFGKILTRMYWGGYHRRLAIDNVLYRL